MIQRYYKANPLKKALLMQIPELVGAVYFFGRIGSGKTTSLLSLSQKYFEKGYKIFDSYGGQRNEQWYWAIPSLNKEYWSKLKRKFNFIKSGPKQYNIHFIYPYFHSMLPKEFPNHLPFVKSSFFTIPFKSLTLDDIQLLLGNISEKTIADFNELQDKIKDNDNAADILFKADKLLSDNSLLKRSVINIFCEDRLFQSANYSSNININKEMRDRKTITILCLDYIPNEYKVFILGYLYRQISVGIDKGKIGIKNIILVREAADFFRVTDISTVNDKYKIFKTQFSTFIKYGRKGIHFFLDCQSPSETKGIVEGQSDIQVICKITGEGDRDEVTRILYKDNFMTKAQISQLSSLNPGECMFVQQNKKVEKKYILLPRTEIWKPGYGNFFNIWEKYDGNWINIKDKKDEIESEFADRMKELKDIEKNNKLLFKQEQEFKKKLDMEKQLQEKEELLLKELEIKEKINEKKQLMKNDRKLKYELKNKIKKEKINKTTNNNIEEISDKNIGVIIKEDNSEIKLKDNINFNDEDII